MLKKIASAIDSLRNKKPHQPTQLTRRVATIDMTGIDDLSDEEKLRVFDLAMQDALKGKSTIANPNQKPQYQKLFVDICLILHQFQFLLLLAR